MDAHVSIELHFIKQKCVHWKVVLKGFQFIVSTPFEHPIENSQSLLPSTIN